MRPLWHSGAPLTHAVLQKHGFEYLPLGSPKMQRLLPADSLETAAARRHVVQSLHALGVPLRAEVRAELVEPAEASSALQVEVPWQLREE